MSPVNSPNDPFVRTGIVALIAFDVALVVFGVVLWVTFRGPVQQLDALTRFNQAIVEATCDSSLYTPDELSRRTEMARRRLDIVCTSRRQIDSALTRNRP